MQQTIISTARRVEQSIKHIQLISQFFNSQEIEVAYSGGKDSDVLLSLCQKADIPFKPVYKNTTIDPVGTIAHCRENDVSILNPEKSFFQLISKKGLPSRFNRWCCAKLKEYYNSPVLFTGVRKFESTKRAKMYIEPSSCRVFTKDVKAQIYHPLLYWSAKEIEDYIVSENIKVHPLYYDEFGKFHVERRLGCIGCPLQSKKSRIQEFKENPKFLNAWLIALRKYWTYKNGVVSNNIFSSPEEHMFCDIFFSNKAEMMNNKNTLFGQMDYFQLLCDTFSYDFTK